MGARVHCLWNKGRLYYPARVEAVRAQGNGKGKATAVYRVRYDDDDEEEFTSVTSMVYDMGGGAM